MGEAEEKILQMLVAGRITAEEAERLMAAMQGPVARVDIYSLPEYEPSEPEEIIMTPEGEMVDVPPAPDMDYFRRFWRIPFLISFTFLLVNVLGLWAARQLGGGLGVAGLICAVPTLVLAFLATVVSFWSRWAYWLHVRVKEKRGRRIAISLPMPLLLMRLMLRFAGRYTSEHQAHNLVTAATFVDSMSRGPKSDPLMIAVDDADGDQVQIYIG